VLGNVELSGLGYWSCCVIVGENSEVVCEELASEDGLVVSCDCWVQPSNKEIAALSSCSLRSSSKCGERNNHVSVWILSESNLETELPK